MKYLSLYLSNKINVKVLNKKDLLDAIGSLKIQINLTSSGKKFSNEQVAEFHTKNIVGKIQNYKISDAISEATDAVINYRENPNLRKYLAYLFFLEKKYEACLSVSSSAFQLNENDSANIILMGVSLNALNYKNLAEKIYSFGILKWPHNYEILNNAGKNYNEMGFYDKAAICLSRAIHLKEDYHAAHNNFANALIKLGNQDGALHHYLRSLEIKNSQEANLNIGNIYKKKGNVTKALEYYNKSESFDVKSAVMFNNIAGLYKDIGLWSKANEYYLKAIDLDKKDLTLSSNYLFTRAICIPIASVYFEEAKKLSYRFESGLNELKRINKFENIKNRKYRIGFVSGDFWSHPVSYFLESFLSYLDKNSVELIAYSSVIYTDMVTQRLRPNFDDWFQIVGMSDKEAAELISKHQIDLLIDLSGHTAENRLGIFGYKPAYKSATWLGFPMTTGLSSIDYFLGDEIISPENMQKYFSEKIVNFQKVFCCFNAPTTLEHEIPIYPSNVNDHFTFGSFNKLSKITDKTIEIWSNLLILNNKYRLYLNSPNYNDNKIILSVLDRFKKNGVEKSQIIFDAYPAGRRDLVLQGYKNIDVVLDTTPYPGGTTSVEAIWMGRPVVTLLGETSISRIGASINSACGFQELIANNCDEFISIAQHVEQNFHKYKQIDGNFRKKLMLSPAFNGQQFANAFLKVVETIIND